MSGAVVLLPCWFCGSEARRATWDSGSCGCGGEDSIYCPIRRVQMSNESWNARHVAPSSAPVVISDEMVDTVIQNLDFTNVESRENMRRALALAMPQAGSAPVVISEEMVERALLASDRAITQLYHDTDGATVRKAAMRAALTAALLPFAVASPSTPSTPPAWTVKPSTWGADFHLCYQGKVVAERVDRGLLDQMAESLNGNGGVA